MLSSGPVGASRELPATQHVSELLMGLLSESVETCMEVAILKEIIADRKLFGELISGCRTQIPGF